MEEGNFFNRSYKASKLDCSFIDTPCRSKQCNLFWIDECAPCMPYVIHNFKKIYLRRKGVHWKFPIR